MAEVKPRVKVPSTASAGEVITIKCLISHKMESGLRKDGDGNLVPRQIINNFKCDFAGENVIDIEMHPAISANPYFEFDVKVEESGDFNFTWTDDDGSVYEDTKSIEVS